MKLYVVFGGPPSLCCRLALEALEVPYDNISVDFNDGEHLTDKFKQVRKLILE